MIYTVTFNPSLDYIVSVDDFKLGMTNRTSSELILPGGKGINVSIVLKSLGLKSVALGYTAGFVGDEISKRLESTGIITNFIPVENGNSRINVKVKNIDGTEINGQGPDISPEKISILKDKLENLTSGDILILAGSIPASMPDDIYMRIMDWLKNKGVMIIVDATSSLLLKVLPYHPFLIKPNHHELGQIFDVSLESREDVIPYAKKLQEMGALNVLISMGPKGGVLVDALGNVYEAEAPEGQLKNSVGAGDSMVAGFTAGWLKSGDYAEAFKLGLATGSASACSDYLASREEVEDFLQRTFVKRR